MKTVLGVIGGSGLYDLPGLDSARWETIASPWGQASDDVLFAEHEGLPVRFLPRHGRGHRLSPGAIDYRANIDVLKRAGVTDLVSVSACGSLTEALAPGALVLVDQFIDRTRTRPSSFFGEGLVAHVSMADPVSPLLCEAIANAASAEQVALVRGGTYVAIEGPQFSTRAESRLYQAWGGDVIGMTNMPEAKLAREAQIAYATLALVTDHDCWHPKEAHVTAEMAIANLMQNAEHAQRVLVNTIGLVARALPQSIAHTALASGLVTAHDSLSPELKKRLDVLLRQ